MSKITEFANTKDLRLLIAAGEGIENSAFPSQQSFENLILNHIGSLLGIQDCTYREAHLYADDGELLKQDKNKARQKLQYLSSQGYAKAIMEVSFQCIDSDPKSALQYLRQCLNNPEVNQGEVNERIGYIYAASNVLDTQDGIPFLKVAADQYDRGYAQYILASLYFYGNGVEKDVETSFKYCLKAAGNGDSNAELWLGKDYIFAVDYPLEQNVALGIDYLTKAAEQGEADAHYFLGYLYYMGEYVPQDVDKAEGSFIMAEICNVPGAFAYLGQIYYERGEYEQAREHLEKSYSQYNLLLCATTLVQLYKNGLGGPQNIAKAVEVVDKLVSQDCAGAEDILFAADAYYAGKGIPRNIDKAVQYYQMIGNETPEIKYKLGCIALEGQSSLLSKNQCIFYLETAGNQGVRGAFSKLGYYFLSVNNADRAREYFQRSFQEGNVDDGVLVGKIYEAGTPSMYKNMNEAVRWYKMAAEKGSQKAMDELSHIKSTLFGYKRV